MNTLDATLTKVEKPVWDEKYQTWRVQVEYNCWGGISSTERWFKYKESAHALKVGDTIVV